MAKVTINGDLCKGCGLCVNVCPRNIVEINKEVINIKGYHPASVVRQEDCIGCAFCATMCPDVCITVEK